MTRPSSARPRRHEHAGRPNYQLGCDSTPSAYIRQSRCASRSQGDGPAYGGRGARPPGDVPQRGGSRRRALLRLLKPRHADAIPTGFGRSENGTRGTVTAVDHGGGELLVRTDDGRDLVLPRWYLHGPGWRARPWLGHGYAMTGHKAQGLTTDRCFVLAADERYKEWGYVAMSRVRSYARPGPQHRRGACAQPRRAPRARPAAPRRPEIYSKVTVSVIAQSRWRCAEVTGPTVSSGSAM